jgi:hypothetical protein
MIFSFPKSSYAGITHYSCKEPQKAKARYVSINWSTQKIGFDKLWEDYGMEPDELDLVAEPEFHQDTWA